MGAMFSHIDGEGHNFQILSNITDHKSDGNEISISDRFIKSINGNNLTNNNTAICKLQVDWKYGSAYLVPLKYSKTSNPL